MIVALLFIAISAVFQTGSSVRQCTFQPVIVDFDFQSIHRAEMKWFLPFDQCTRNSELQVSRYEIQQLCSESCDTRMVETRFTESNKTSVCLHLSLTTSGECYFRLRSELNNGSYSPYSECILVDHNFFMATRSWYVERNEDACTPIIATCNNLRRITYFYLNDIVTEWPRYPLPSYNITPNRANGIYQFCFNNITRSLKLLEFCYKPAGGCVWCTESISYRVLLLSRATIAPRPRIQENASNTCLHYSTVSDLENTILPTSTLKSISATEITTATVHFGSFDFHTNKTSLDFDSRISISLAVSVPAVFVIGGGIVSVCLSLLVFKHNKNNRGVKEENSQQLQQNKNSSTKVVPVYESIDSTIQEPVYEEMDKFQAEICERPESLIETAKNVSYGEIRRITIIHGSPHHMSTV